MTKSKQEHKELAMSDTRDRSCFDALPVSLYQTTPAGQFLDVNLAMVEMLGYPSREALLATTLFDHYVHPEDRERWKALLEQEEGVRKVEFQIRRCNGTLVWVSDTVKAEKDEQGCVLSYEGCLEDISERKRAQAEYEQSLKGEREQRRLAEAVRQAGAVLTSTLNYDEVLKRILEQMGQVVPHDTANIMLIDRDQAQVIEGIGYDQFEIQVRVTPITLNMDKASILQRMRKNGQPKAVPYVESEAEWVYARPEHTWIKSYAGAPIRIRSQVIGFLNVNSARAGFFGQAHAEQLQIFADQAAIAIENARLYQQAQQELAERMRAESELRRSQDQLEHRNRELEATRDELRQTNAALQEAMKKLKENFDQLKLTQKSLQELNQSLEATVAKRTQQLKEKNEELLTLSVTDRLTGLYNRGKLDETLASEIYRAKRYNHPLGIILLDIDHFKSVNDTYGHQVGDQVLTEIAEILKNFTRKTDLAGRWGGEEFLIICLEIDQNEMLKLAEKLRAIIEKHEFPIVQTKTASFGVTSYNKDDSSRSMIARADAALYNAKGNGRNRVEIV